MSWSRAPTLAGDVPLRPVIVSMHSAIACFEDHGIRTLKTMAEGHEYDSALPFSLLIKIDHRLPWKRASMRA
jgi:hypothetical protein